MKLKYFICCTLLSGAFSLTSCDKDEVIVNPSSAEKIISLVNQHQPAKIYIDYGTKEYEYSDYYIDDYWLVTLVPYYSDNIIITKPQYWNLADVSHFDILEDGLYFVLSFN